MESFLVQVHGGAWDIPNNLLEPHRKGVWSAYQKAMELLKKGIPPLHVVVETLEVMENDTTFDAGRGSFLNENGEVELDSGIMEGKALKAGAVASVGGFSNPSRIALAVLEKTEHVLLVGKGAEDFALKQGFERVNPEFLIHPRELALYRAWVSAGKPDAKKFFSSQNPHVGQEPEKRGTVGVVIAVLNESGHYDLYAGTSTGGTPGKRAGRVGDVPLVGCGFYADNEGAAVSSTGWGEGLMRIAAAKSVSERVRIGMHPQEAVETVLRDMWKRTEGRGGLIAFDFQGQSGAAYTTPEMAYAGHRCIHIDI